MQKPVATYSDDLIIPYMCEKDTGSKTQPLQNKTGVSIDSRPIVSVLAIGRRRLAIEYIGSKSTIFVNYSDIERISVRILISSGERTLRLTLKSGATVNIRVSADTVSGDEHRPFPSYTDINEVKNLLYRAMMNE